jgi:hypothetical protein
MVNIVCQQETGLEIAKIFAGPYVTLKCTIDLHFVVNETCIGMVLLGGFAQVVFG